MSRLSIPGLVDLLTVSDPATIRALADSPDLDRKDTGGPLAVRFLRGRLARALNSPKGPLPSALPRDSAERIALRAELYQKLAVPDLDARLAGAVTDAACYVAAGEGSAGIVTQTLFGRIFVADFTADSHTWRAALVLSRALALPSFQSLADVLSGRVTGAQAALSRAMQGDRNGVHAIGVAVHNFAETLTRMRDLDKSTHENEALAKTLVAPERVARQGASVAETVAGRVRPGTFVVLEVGSAASRTLDPRVGFLSEAWSGCPAHTLVPKLASRIWLEAGGAS
jgi:hypothetical protein